MKLAFWLLTLCVLTATMIVAAKYNSGYILLVAQPYRIELSLNLLIIMLVTLFIIGYFLIRLVIITLQLPTEAREFRLHRHHEKARATMLDGIKAFFEGHYTRAEIAMTAALKLEESPETNAISTIIAARSAHKLKKYSERDQFIIMMRSIAPESTLLRLMTQAELLLDEGRSGEALKVLQALHFTETNQHTALLHLKLRAWKAEKNWSAVIDLVNQLEKHGDFDKTLARQLRQDAYLKKIKKKELDVQSFAEFWQDIPLIEREDSKLTAAAADVYIEQGNYVIARQIIEHSLNKQWDADLIRLYTRCIGDNTLEQIEYAEEWLKSYPSDAQLLFALGQFSAHCELWDKAQNYLKASLTVTPNHLAHLALAQLNEKIGNPEKARDHYREGLKLTSGL